MLTGILQVQTKFFLDDVEQTTQYGAGYTGAGFWLIINLQMEGSSGSPGPTAGALWCASTLLVILGLTKPSRHIVLRPQPQGHELRSVKLTSRRMVLATSYPVAAQRLKTVGTLMFAMQQRLSESMYMTFTLLFVRTYPARNAMLPIDMLSITRSRSAEP